MKTATPNIITEFNPEILEDEERACMLVHKGRFDDFVDQP